MHFFRGYQDIIAIIHFTNEYKEFSLISCILYKLIKSILGIAVSMIKLNMNGIYHNYGQLFGIYTGLKYKSYILPIG